MTFLYRFSILISFSLLPGLLMSQESENEFSWARIQDQYKLKTSLGFQLWSTYTLGQELYQEESDDYLAVGNRWNNQIRRSRLSVSGQPYDQLTFKLTAALDLVGRDANAATQGGNNNGGRPQFALWNMFLRWKVLKESDLAHITFGYQLPQIGRESINGALRANSFEKSWSQNYLRRSIVGTGPGRVMGINFGGQKKFSPNFHIDYNLGVFSPQTLSPLPNSQGISNSPLLISRIGIHFGDPENNRYSSSHKVNYFGKRNGLTVGVSNSYQGNTDAFASNEALSFDFLWNWKMLHMDGEWTFFKRSFSGSDLSDTNISYQSGYARIGYNFRLNEAYFIEPVIMWTQFNGMHAMSDYLLLADQGIFAGTDRILEFSINFHLNKDLKITANYTKNDGEPMENILGFAGNNYFRNSNGDAIRRGDLLALGILIIIK